MSQLDEVMRQARKSVEAGWNKLLQNPSSEFIKFVKSEIGISEKGMDSLVKQVIQSSGRRNTPPSPPPPTSAPARGQRDLLEVHVDGNVYRAPRPMSAKSVLLRALADIALLLPHGCADLVQACDNASLAALDRHWIIPHSDFVRVDRKHKKSYGAIEGTDCYVNTQSSTADKAENLAGLVDELGISSRVQIWLNGQPQ